jgi:sulfotransferase
MKLHFISGLPRSGSTLLAALLRQNPRFHASMMSPVGEIFNAMLRAISVKNEAAVFLNSIQRQRLLSSCFTAYYGSCHHDVAFDTNRQWTTKLSALVELFPACRMICMVRNPAWVLDSVERLIKSNPFDLSGIFNFDPGGTVYTRAEQLSKGDGMIGFAYGGLKEAVYGPHADRLLLVRYETLVANPMEILGHIYRWIDEADELTITHEFIHEFDDIAPLPDIEEFDARLGTPGLHKVLPKVIRPDHPTVLPPDLFARYEKDAFWEKDIPAKVV